MRKQGSDRPQGGPAKVPPDRLPPEEALAASITFRAEPDARSRAVIDYRLDCDVEPRRDRRCFATYEAAVAGLADHALHCAVALCTPQTVHVVSRRPCDDEPVMNVSTVNGVFLLRALGLVPELSAAAVARPGQPPAPACLDAGGLIGECDALDFQARVDLALALSQRDEGLAWHPVVPGSNVTDCGRPAGYLHDRLHELRAITVFAHGHAQRPVIWG